MERTEEILALLSDHIHDHQSHLVDAWWEICEKDVLLGPVGKLTREQFRNNIPSALKGFRAVIHSTDENVLDLIHEEVAKHGHHRWKQGFNLRELIRDWGHLNRALVRDMERFFSSHQALNTDAHQIALDRLALFITEATSGSVQRYDELRREEAEALANDLSVVEKQFDAVTKERSRILREATHDIQGNLSALVFQSKLFRDTSDMTPGFEDVLDRMDNGLVAVSEMLRSLLDLARLESGKEIVSLSRVDIVEILSEFGTELKSVALQKGIDLRLEGPDELVVTTDPMKIQRIAQNLIINALQHTAEGHVTVVLSLEATAWQLRVEDTGPGVQAKKGSTIAQELKEKDIDSSEKNNENSFAYTGEGVGLTIVKRLCDLLHASIHLESTLGEGSIFTIRFPLEYDEESLVSSIHGLNT